MKRANSTNFSEQTSSSSVASSSSQNNNNQYRIGHITDLLMEIHHEYKNTTENGKKAIISTFINPFGRDELDEICKGFLSDIATLKKISDGDMSKKTLVDQPPQNKKTKN